jgi:phosphoglycerol transferase
MIGLIPIFIKNNFGETSFDQLLFFISIDEATTGTDEAVITSAINYFLIYPALATIGTGVAIYILLKIHPVTPKILIILTLSAAAISITYTLKNIGAIEYFFESNDSDKFAQHFHNPNPATIKPNAKYNLILLYVESLESDFKFNQMHGVDVNKPLTRIFKGQPFKIIQTPGANWTTAGMISSQCGVPLAGFIQNKGDKIISNAMLKNQLCISDYLDKFDYHQIFMVGPDLKFSGMDKFYNHHHFDETIGLEEFKQIGIPNEFFTGWGKGIHDDTLLDFAFKKIDGVRKLNKPFNMVIITTDNHTPHGYPSPKCKVPLVKGAKFIKSFECTNLWVEKFYNQLKDSNYLDDTIFAVMGDHLFMDFDVHHKGYFNKKSDRRVFFNFVMPGNQVCANTNIDITHFDIAPTLLSATLGTNIDRVGIGENICRKNSTNPQRFKDITDEKIIRNSEKYWELW